MTPAIIGTICQRFLAGGGGLGPDFDFQGVSYTPPVSDSTTDDMFDFQGVSYTPPVSE